MAGITTPFTTPTFPFLQTVSQRTLDNITPAFVLQNGPSVQPIALTPAAGLGQGVFAVDSALGSGYVQQWNVSVRRELTTNTAVEAAYVGSNIAHVGVPDSNLNQLSVDQLALGSALVQRVQNPYFGIIRGRPRSAIRRFLSRSSSSRIRPTRRSASTATTSAPRVTGTRAQPAAAAGSRADVLGRLHPLQARGRCLVGVRRVDPDRPIANYPVADSFNRARERDYSTGDIPTSSCRRSCGISPRARAVPGASVVCAGRSPMTGRSPPWSRWESGTPVAVTQTTNFNAFAGFGVQRPNLVGGSDPAGRSADAQSVVQHGGLCRRAAVHDRLVVAQPGPRSLVSRRRSRADATDTGGPESSDRGARRSLQPVERAEPWRPERRARAANFGTITTAFDPRVIQFAVKFLF